MNRADRFIPLMEARQFKAALITKPENMRYLTGYTGEGSLFISQAGAVIITDFRYVEQAGRQSPSCAVMQTTSELKAEAIVKRLVDEHSISSLACESDYLTVDAWKLLEAQLSGIELLSLGKLPEELRLVKDADEIESIKQASEIACKAFGELLSWVKPGMTEKRIQVQLDYAMLALGAECVAFDTIACAGPNGSLPHAVPSDRPVQAGELLTLDFGAQVNGYKCDMTRTIAIGDVSDELKRIYETVLRAQLAALSIIKPGVRCADVDKTARDIIDAIYPGAFGHSLGHGVGLNIHEAPGFSRLSEATVAPGHVLTVEPGVYLPGIGGCRIEDMVIITENGFINPITAPKELIVV